MLNIKTTIKSVLVILAILIVLATLSVFFYIMLSSYNVMTDPQFANGVVRDDIMWDDVYCEKHDCKLEYITDRTKKLVDGGWILILTFIGSIWTWASNYIGKVSGIKQGRMMQKIEDIQKMEEEAKKMSCDACGREFEDE